MDLRVIRPWLGQLQVAAGPGALGAELWQGQQLVGRGLGALEVELCRGQQLVGAGHEVLVAPSRWVEVLALVPAGVMMATNGGGSHPAWVDESLAYVNSAQLL